MATIVPLTYRCRLQETESALPVFVDLGSVRSGPLSERVALGRLLTVPRVIGSPIRVMVNDVHDLADPLDQQVVAGLLAQSESQLVVAGVLVQPDTAVLPLRDEIRRIADATAWFAPAEPDEDDPSLDVRQVVKALVVGLEILPSQVAALLNEIPAWAKRGPERGFNRQSVNHFVSRQAGPPAPIRLWDSSLATADLGKNPSYAVVALTVCGYVGALAALTIRVPDGGAGLTGAGQVILGRIVERSGGHLQGAPIPELPAAQQRILDRVLDFALDVVQGRFLNRRLPAGNLVAAHQKARGMAAGGSNVRSIVAALNAAGYLTVSTTGTWSTSTVTSLIGSDAAPVRRTDGGGSL